MTRLSSRRPAPRATRLAATVLVASLAGLTGLASGPARAQAQTPTAAAATTPAAANAAPAVRTERTLSTDLAVRIATATVAACQANGHAVTATVVDRAGGVRAVVRGDGAGPHTLAASERKAFTSASARNATLAMMEGAQKNPAAANLVHIPGFLLLGGGVPVRAGQEVVGAVGVGGAPGGHLDEQCALAALEQVRESLR